MAFVNNLAYEASAGSGKTFMLVVRYLSLLFQGADPSKILALTFTNKAASEMQERVVLTLEELETRGELDVILEVTGFSKEFVLSERKKILNQFLNANTKIMTIDKFFTQILRKFSLYASLMPDFSTFAAQHEIKLMSRFLKEVSVSGKKDTLITLSLQSKKRLESIFALLDDFYVKKQELNNITFEKADYIAFENEALSYVKELQAIVYGCKEASSTAKKGVDADSFEALQAKAWLSRDTFEYSTFKKCYTPSMDTLLVKIKEAIKNQNRAKEKNFFYALSELLEIYEKSKKALYMDDSELSFSDVTSLVYYILNKIDDSEFLYFRLDAQIEHMLLDEFQDTSILQYEILKPLIQEITSGNGIFENASFFFVGDVKQSIYRFRGGVSALFDTVRQEQNTTVEKLTTNYRSQKEVVEFVNDTFKAKIKNYTPQKVKDGAIGGYVAVVQSDELLDEVVENIKTFVELGANINEIAVLCATNGDGEAVKMRLIEENLEVVTETTTKLINQKSVKAVLEYLKYLYFGEEIYRHNFFALIGQELKSIYKLDLSKTKLFDVIKKAIDKYSLFEDDFHLIRFLNAISRYQDIEALLFEYERLDTEAAASDLSGVRVLTIHKSKGLEYEHVIVMDRLKKQPANRAAIIYEYDHITLKNVYLRMKGRDAIDDNYANALSKEKALVIEDSLNALYVAFTRARDNLIVVQKSKDSMFDILDLNVMTRGMLKVEALQVKSSKENLQKLEYTNFYYGTQSDILNVEEKNKEDLKSINFGLAMHYMLEMLDFSDLHVSVEKACNMMVNKYGALLESSEIEDIKNRVLMLIDSSEFQTLIQGKCYKEKSIRYKDNLRYIDLLVNNNEIWSVIDYKSAMSFTDKHHQQVSYYVNAIEEITKQTVKGYICYLLESEIKIISI